MNNFGAAFIMCGAAALSCCSPSQGVTATLATNTLRFAVGTAPDSVAIADVNDDHKLDIIVANGQSNDVTILLGDGKGGFAQAKNSPFSAGHAPSDIATGDFNGDGRLDLAFANHEMKYLTVLLGDGQGQFSPAPHSPFAVQSRPHTHGVASADFNGDGNLDLVTESWGNNQVIVLLGDGKGDFKTPGSLFSVGRMPYQMVRAADLNKDGKADIVTTNFEGGNVTILLGDGKGSFTQAAGSPFACGNSPFSVAIGDLNKDGNADLAIANYSGQGEDRSADAVNILLGDGRGNFKPMSDSPFRAGGAPVSVATGDINGDSIPDVVTANMTGNDLTVLLGSSKGTLTGNPAIAAGRQPYRVALGDLNGDGKADIATANNGDNNITVILSR